MLRGSGVDSDGAGVEIVEEPDAPPASADRKGPYWEMWKLEVCSCLQPAAGLQCCCNSFMYHCWLQCCKCSKKWIEQEGPWLQHLGTLCQRLQLLP